MYLFIKLMVWFPKNTGQVSQDCSAPDKYPNTKLETKYARRQKFSHNEKVYYSCDDDFTAFRGSRAVQCVDGQWTKLTLKCESKNLPWTICFQGRKKKESLACCFTQQPVYWDILRPVIYLDGFKAAQKPANTLYWGRCLIDIQVKKFIKKKVVYKKKSECTQVFGKFTDNNISYSLKGSFTFFFQV